MQNRFRILICLFVIEVTRPALFPQTGTQTAPAVFRSDTVLVHVRVTAKDAAGRPIDDLTEQDFQIFEDRKPRRIAFFQRETLTLGSASHGSAREAAVPAIPQKDSPQETRDHRLLILFFDLTSLSHAAQERSFDAAKQFIQTQLSADDLVAIASISGTLRVDQEFTADRDTLIRSLDSLFAGGSIFSTDPGPAPDAVSGATSAATDLSTSARYEFALFQNDRRLSALESISRRYAAVQQKKLLLYFSGGISIRQGMARNLNQLNLVTNIAVKSGVSIYPIDARGLIALPPGGDASTGTGDAANFFRGSKQSASIEELREDHDTMYALAADTGGKAWIDDNAITEGIVNAQHDLSTYYILAYYADHAEDDASRHAVNVRVNRPHAQLAYSSGYSGEERPERFSRLEKEDQLRLALESNLLRGSFTLSTAVHRLRQDDSHWFAPVVISIPGEVAFATGTSAKAPILDVIVQVRNPARVPVATVRDEIKLRALDASSGSVKPVTYDSVFILAPGRYTARIVVRQQATGQFGVQETEFTLPEAHSAGLDASSLVLSFGRTPIASALGNAAPLRQQEKNPLVQSGRKLVPNASGIFESGSALRAYAEAYEPAPRDGVRTISANLVLLRADEAVAATAPTRFVEGEGARKNVIPIETELFLTDIEPGEYTCQLNVLDESQHLFTIARAAVKVVRNQGAQNPKEIGK